MSSSNTPDFVRFDWPKWLQTILSNSSTHSLSPQRICLHEKLHKTLSNQRTSVLGRADGLVSQAIVVPTSLESVELYGPVLGHIGFDNVAISDLLTVISLIAQRRLQHNILDLTDRQYVITSVHDHSFCGRLIQQSSKGKDGGVVIIRANHATLIASYESPAQPFNVVPYIEEYFKDISGL